MINQYLLTFILLCPFSLTAGGNCCKPQKTLPGIYIKVALVNVQNETVSYDHENHTYDKKNQEMTTKAPVNYSDPKNRIALCPSTIDLIKKQATISYKVKTENQSESDTQSISLAIGQELTNKLENTPFSVRAQAIYIND